jgi:DNA-binding NtrC family response regulator
VLRPPRVLVIDDERYIRGLLAELLAVWGCETDVAATSTEGLALLDLKSYDLVLTDYVMPGGTGVELVERVRGRDPGIGVIMLTGSGAELESDGHRLRFTVLRKPLQIDRLETAVKQLLNHRQIEA